MAHSVRRGLVVLIKGAGVVAAILGILVLIALVWFTINPPFASPETGRLHASASRELRLEAGQASLAIALEARLNDNAMRPSADPPVLRASISPIEGGTLDGVHIRLAPGAPTPALEDVRETGGTNLDWTMPCSEGVANGCRQRLMILLDALPSAVERRWRLNVGGDLQYPALVPTPGWSSFDLELRTVGDDGGMERVPFGEASGRVDLTADQPVVIVPVHVERGGAPDTGDGLPQAALRLAIDATRLTETAPAGFDAPPPVRASVLTADGTVLARQGARPGADPRILSLALDACATSCATDYLIAFEWMDARPEADFRLNWRAEVIGLPDDDRAPVPVVVQAGDPDPADLAWEAVLPGPDRDPLRGQRLDVFIGGSTADELAGSPLHLQLLATATVDQTDQVGTTIVRIDPMMLGGSFGIPFNVNPGESGAVSLNLEGMCIAALCEPVVLMASSSNRDGAAVATQLDVTWRLEGRAWRLAPDGAPVDLFLQVE